MLSLTNGKKHMYLLLLGVFIAFSISSVFAQAFENEEETQSWVIDMWSPTNTTPITTTSDQIAAWDIGSALGMATEPEETSSKGSSGSGHGGRLGTANYSLRNRSKLVSMERQAMVAQKQQEKTKLDPPHTIVDLPETNTQNTIVKDEPAPPPIEMVDHLLVTEAGRDDLVTPYQKPIRQTQQQKHASSEPQVIRSSAPRQNTRAQNFKSQTGSILVKSETFPIDQTHLLSWEGVQEDITSYKQDVIKKIILNVLVITGKGLFYISIVGILLFLLFREKLTIFHRNKVRQLTLFSLLK